VRYGQRQRGIGGVLVGAKLKRQAGVGIFRLALYGQAQLRQSVHEPAFGRLEPLPALD
jgi:hypothetical protein